jgi:hypothetical protein
MGTGEIRSVGILAYTFSNRNNIMIAQNKASARGSQEIRQLPDEPAETDPNAIVIMLGKADEFRHAGDRQNALALYNKIFKLGIKKLKQGTLSKTDATLAGRCAFKIITLTDARPVTSVGKLRADQATLRLAVDMFKIADPGQTGADTFSCSLEIRELEKEIQEKLRKK